MDRSQALKNIAAQAARGELTFPTGTEVALKVKRVLDDPECHIDTAARLVQSEPLLAARTVAVANSVAYNPFGREVTSVRGAVSRLGFRTLRSLATAVAARQMAGSLTRPEHRAMADQLWEHTTHVAALAHVIARRVTRLDPETALFAGIVHEVGSFYLISRAEEFPCLLEEGSNEDDEDDDDHDAESEVGRAVLQALMVPQSITTALDDFWPGYLALPPKTLGDTVLLADCLAAVKSPLHQPEEGSAGPDAVIDLTTGDETLQGILEESAEDVRSLVAALNF